MNEITLKRSRVVPRNLVGCHRQNLNLNATENEEPVLFANMVAPFSQKKNYSFDWNWSKSWLSHQINIFHTFYGWYPFLGCDSTRFSNQYWQNTTWGQLFEGKCNFLGKLLWLLPIFQLVVTENSVFLLLNRCLWTLWNFSRLNLRVYKQGY